jgi:hypothetical protein
VNVSLRRQGIEDGFLAILPIGDWPAGEDLTVIVSWTDRGIAANHGPLAVAIGKLTPDHCG